MSELDKFSKYSNEIYCINKIPDSFINSLLMNLKQYESPDLLSIFDDYIIGIEHFEFDCYKKNRKGSDYQIKENTLKTDIKAEVQINLKNHDSTTVTREMESTASLENYINNFQNVFMNHCRKVKKYKENISQKINTYDKNLKICFFIEDVTPLGCYTINKNAFPYKLTPFLPVFSKQIRELFKNTPQIEYLILGIFNNTKYQLIFIENKKEIIEMLFEDHKEIHKDDFTTFKQHSVCLAEKVRV